MGLSPTLCVQTSFIQGNFYWGRFLSNSSLQEIIACIGYPVAGNPTQFVMERAFRAAGVDSRCLTLDVPPEDLANALRGMLAMGFCGATLACPHQAPASKLVDERSKVAEALGEIDLIHRDGQKLVGDHSLVHAVTQVLSRQVDIGGKHAILFGDGHLVTAITLALCLAAPEKVTLFAKDDAASESTRELISQYSATKIEIQPWLDSWTIPSSAGILIATGADKMPFDLDSLSNATVILDTDYQMPRTAFIKAGEEAGCTCITGLDLLVQQASVAFHSWTGLTPDLPLMREAFEEFLML